MMAMLRYIVITMLFILSASSLLSSCSRDAGPIIYNAENVHYSEISMSPSISEIDEEILLRGLFRGGYYLINDKNVFWKRESFNNKKFVYTFHIDENCENYVRSMSNYISFIVEEDDLRQLLLQEIRNESSCVAKYGPMNQWVTEIK